MEELKITLTNISEKTFKLLLHKLWRVLFVCIFNCKTIRHKEDSLQSHY